MPVHKFRVTYINASAQILPKSGTLMNAIFSER